MNEALLFCRKGGILSVRLVSTPETAHMLGIKPQTLRIWRLKGIGPRYRRLGASIHGRVVYDEADVVEWASENRYFSTSEETAKQGMAKKGVGHE